MQSVSSGDILHEMSDPIFLEKIEKKKNNKQTKNIITLYVCKQCRARPDSA